MRKHSNHTTALNGNFNLEGVIRAIEHEKGRTRMSFEGRVRWFWCDTTDYVKELEIGNKLKISYDICTKGTYTQVWIRTIKR